MLPQTEIGRLVRDFYERELAIDAAARRAPCPIEASDADLTISSLTILAATIRDHLARGEFVLVADFAREAIERDGLGIAPDSGAYRVLCQALLRSRLEATNRQLERWGGDWTGRPSDPLLSLPAVPQASVGTSAPDVRPIDDLLSEFFKERKFSPKHESEFRDSIDWFQDYIGRHKQITDFSKADFVSYKNALQQLPANFRKHFPGASVRKAIELNATVKRPTLSVASINNKRLGNLDSFMGWAKKNGYIVDNPAAGIRVEVARGSKHKKKRDPFTIDQLNSIFRAPTFVGCKSSQRWKESGDFNTDDHRKWLPLVALFSGARQGELAQLLVADVKKVGAVWTLHITDDGDEGADKSVKNAESRRTVPIHPELVKLGFLKYVERQRKAGHARLFPECQRGADGSFSPFSKHFRRFLDSLQIKKSGRTVFHSFRHGFEDRMRAAGMPDSVRFALAGRTFNHSSEDYGRGYAPDRLYEELVKVTYPGLNLRHLYVKAS